MSLHALWLDLLLAGSAFYTAVIGWLLVGVGRSRTDRRRSPATPTVSVVVAARDEVGRIGACLLALARQDYAGPLQIVVVDDRSSDGTGDLVERVRLGWRARSELVLVHAPDAPRFACPKKSALAAGIDAATGELLLFTDADCEPPRGWASAMAARFIDGVGLVAGFAYAEPLTRLRHGVLAVDNLGVGALAEGSLAMGAPLACTGRSLAYRRSVYDEVGGFSAIGHLVGGDDVYFARRVAARTGWSLAYCADPGAAVPGPPGATTWRGLLDQKARHAAKAAHYEGGARWLGLAAYTYHAALFGGLAEAAATGAFSPVFAAAWLARWAADGLLLWRFAPRGPADRVLLAFLPLVELLYIPYVLFLVPLGRAGRFRWKGRSGATAGPGG